MHGVLASVLLIFLSFSSVSTQRVTSGKCPDVAVKPTFEAKKYFGLWYEIEKYPAAIEIELDCVASNYTAAGDNIKMVRWGIMAWNQQMLSRAATLTTPDKKTPAKLQMQWESNSYWEPYWILDTNYEEYAVMYSCRLLAVNLKTEILWILSRKTTLDSKTVQKIHKMLEEKKLNPSYLKQTAQSCNK